MVLAYADRILDEFPLTRGKARILSLLRFLEELPIQGTDTDLARTVQGFVHRNQRRGLAVVVSDLFDPRGVSAGLDLLRHHRYPPHVIQLHDPREADPDLLGDVELYDVENESVSQVTISEKNLRTYRQLFAEHQASVAEYCVRYNLSCTQTNNKVKFDDLVLRMMRVAGTVR
jgi:hypothetical protein